MKIRSSWGSAAAIVMMSSLAVTSLAAAQQPSLPSRPMLIASDAMTRFVTEASQRFGVPDPWIRAVMQVESAGDSNSTSSAGAMGLMQVMPLTYAMLRARLGLGASPYDPHDNIMAGAAYLREMHDRYGSAGFLAAYNAGPGRFEEFRAGVRPLPAETVHYLARLNPMLGIDGPTMLADDNLAVTHVTETSPIFVRLPPPSGATGLQSSGQQNMQVAATDMPTDLQTGSLLLRIQPPPFLQGRRPKLHRNGHPTRSRPPCSFSDVRPGQHHDGSWITRRTLAYPGVLGSAPELHMGGCGNGWRMVAEVRESRTAR